VEMPARSSIYRAKLWLRTVLVVSAFGMLGLLMRVGARSRHLGDPPIAFRAKAFALRCRDEMIGAVPRTSNTGCASNVHTEEVTQRT
jgi:hypothetical protein